MIESIIRLSIKHWVIVIISSLALTFISIRAVQQTPLDAIPDLSDIQVIIFTEWAGQSPNLVEDQVTYPIVTALLGGPKVKYVRGQSFFGLSFVNVIFEDDTDLYWARSRVLEYMSSVQSQLPAGVSPELGPDATGVGWIYQYAVIDKSGKHSLADLRSIQDWIIQYDLKGVPGVAEVASIGGFIKQYQVKLDPNKMLAYNISIPQVVKAVKGSNIDTGARIIEIAGTEHMVRGLGYIKTPADLEVVPVAEFQGTPVFIRDLGIVTLGAEMRRGAAELDGEGESVGGIVVMRWGGDAKKILEAVKEKIKEVQAAMPEGVEIVTVYDRSELIDNAIAHLFEKLVEEIIVVSLVVIIFLWHFRSALIAIIPLPIAILISFIPMGWTGLTANIMSLSGIAIAIGAMVDASIVLVENAHKRLEEWEDAGKPGPRMEVIADAMAEMGRPLFFAILVITVSFFPVFALTGTEGRLFKPLAFTKTFSMAAAALLAITLTPALAVPFLRGKIHSEKRHPVSRVLRTVYEPFCLFALKYKKVTTAIGLLFILSTVPVYMKLGTEFMPPLDEGSILYMPTAIPGMSMEEGLNILHRVNRELKKIPEIDHIFGKVGRSRSATDSAPPSMIESVITLIPKDQWREGMTMKKLQQEMDQIAQIPGMPNIWWMPIQTRTEMLATGIRTALGIKVLGPDVETIERVGLEIERVLADLEGTRSAFAERTTGGNFIDFKVDREAAARFGLTVKDALETITIAIGGKNVSTTVEGRERYPINVRYFRDFRSSLQDLERVIISTPKGVHIPLTQIASFSVTTGPPYIRSEDAKLASFVFVDIDQDKVPLGDYVEAAKILVKEKVTLPTGVSLIWAGQYENLARAAATFKVVIPFTLLIVVMLIYFNTKDLMETLLIMLAIPISLVGAFWILFILDYNLSVAVWVGIIALVGLDAEMGVLLMLYTKISYEKWKREGRLNSAEDFNRAITEGAVNRIRPVVMTAAAILIGLSPVMFGEGSGAQIMKRIAAPMLGGTVTTVLLGRFLYPVIFAYWKQKEARKHWESKALEKTKDSELLS